jgi:hypothetical protein
MKPYLKETQINILKNLAKYKYLTTKQIISIGIVKSMPNLNPLLIDMRKKPKALVNRIVFGVHPKVGKLNDIYFLTRKGVVFLIENDKNGEFTEHKIKYPKNTSSLFYNDYFHRINTIDFLIRFNDFITINNYKILLCDTYFDKVSDKTKKQILKAKTQIKLINASDTKSIIPDCNIIYIAKKQRHLFLLEIANGKNTKRILNQIKLHILALNEGAPSRKYNLEKANRLVMVFEYESIMGITIKHLHKITKYDNYLIFKTVDRIKQKNNFNDGWLTVTGKTTTFIP